MLKKFDNSFLTDKIKIIAGIDEAGRGPLAGPVVAAATVFSGSVSIDGVNDSKQVKENLRVELFNKIRENCLAFGIGIIDENEIEEINILQATLKAMKTAVEKLSLEPDLLLIDGNKSFISSIPAKTIVQGDSKSFAIAAASILAKVTRDKIMETAHEKYPQYSWNKNKGYATKEHIEMIRKYGPSPLHRRKFLRKILSSGEQCKLF